MAATNWRKYRNKKIETPYGTFDSKKEYEHFKKLKSLECQGFITDLQRQVPFELIPKQTVNGKLAELPTRYIADFVYMNDGVQVVEDVKGVKTPDYIIKRKLMLYVHGIRVQEI